jgi:3-isopropylmalate/(R)-2-methylmalate dehydratase large subunit
MTLCNMTIEWGGRTSLIAPDDKAFAFCRGRSAAPSGAEWDEAVAWWRTLPTDSDAVFDREVDVDCSEVAPQITWGTDPSQVIPVTDRIPADEARTRGALDYMGLEGGHAIVGTPIDRVFIGSCSNSRLSDLRLAADVVRGRRVAPGVTAIVVPGSSTIKRDAEREGLDAVFVAAGFEWRSAGCSMCAGANGDVGNSGERVVATSNRNFEHRQGRGVRTHLASPAMAAAAALAGCIVDVRDLLPLEA